MSIVKPSPARYYSTHLDNVLEITIPAHRLWFLIIFLCVWIMGWAVGELSIGGILLGGFIQLLITGIPWEALAVISIVGLFQVAWFIGWTIGGAIAIYGLAWQIKGKEKIVVDNERITICYEIGRWQRAKTYLQKDLLNLRISHVVTSRLPSKSRFSGIRGGIIAFDYGAKTIRFGSGIDEAEGNMIVAEIQQRFPIYHAV